MDNHLEKQYKVVIKSCEQNCFYSTSQRIIHSTWLQRPPIFSMRSKKIPLKNKLFIRGLTIQLFTNTKDFLYIPCHYLVHFIKLIIQFGNVPLGTSVLVQLFGSLDECIFTGQKNTINRKDVLWYNLSSKDPHGNSTLTYQT